MFRSASTGPRAPERWLADGGDRRRLTVGIALAVLAGVCLALASPQFGVWPLVVVGFATIAAAQNMVLPARYSGAALALGFGGYLLVVVAGALQPSQRWWFVPIVVALWIGGRVSRAWHEATGFRHLAWADPVLWVGTLFLLGMSPLASWVDPAYDLYRQPWLIQPVSVVAESGLNLVIMLASYAIAVVCIGRSARARLTTAAAVVLVAAWTATSLVQLGADHAGRTIRVAVVQPGLEHLKSPRDPAARQSLAESTLATLGSATRAAAADGAQLVVWPEATLRYVDPTQGDLDLGALTRETGVHLVFGYTPDPARFNRAALLTPAGEYQALYDKQHPVTFQGDHSVGGPVRVASTGLGRIAPIICYDIDYEDTARSAARQHAQLLAVPSEDWSGIARMHYTRLVFRAVENRLAAAKADTAWDSAVVDPEGRLVTSHVSTQGDAVVLTADVPLGSGRSVFVHAGNVVGPLCVVLSGLWVVWATATALGRRRRVRGRLTSRSRP